ncbi:hypothetical protein BLA24_18265 [Streptomyces cinnamoneus]|uniref:Gram-positive cocci surface proteins LPxTG domain-containing protein n=1 Tax=Streptomyces cinnamoneus TaxID=53446 RepID=A0A2G1XHK5_STRCJ|nr:hypothetical protein [Streptomyces cinnamoneus]PHQ50728.1 hypothetical protein BLA24_18265 [Streptomyces cinnamoneus]PPT14016.1 hypothetical protein CYQ11_15010 [Streptomyces cinnamoneus]
MRGSGPLAGPALAAVVSVLIAPWPARAGQPGPAAPEPPPSVAATTATTVFPSAPPSPGADALAGTVAGEGRIHPGRSSGPPEAGAAASPSPVPTGRGTPDRRHGAHQPPGEAVPGEEEDGAVDEPDDLPPASYGAVPLPAPEHAPPRETQGSTDRVMRVLPLGTGMALTGLGLGFIALRLRRR